MDAATRARYNDLRDLIHEGKATRADMEELARLLETPKEEWAGELAHFEALNHNAKIAIKEGLRKARVP